jgi:hypothetical protein
MAAPAKIWGTHMFVVAPQNGKALHVILLKHTHVNPTLARMVPHVSIQVTSTHVFAKKVLKASTANMT